jgi:hypothetical protein
LVGVRLISRIGTRMPRVPSIYTFREAGKGWVVMDGELMAVPF